MRFTKPTARTFVLVIAFLGFSLALDAAWHPGLRGGYYSGLSTTGFPA